MSRTPVPLLLLLNVVAVAPAAADRTSYHATATGDIAFTDNVFAEQLGNRDGDLFFQIRPGLMFTYGMPRMIHDLNVEAEVTQYALHSEEASLTGRGAWRAFFLPGPRSEVVLQANAGSSVLSAITPGSPADQPVMVELQPLGRVYVLSGDASQYLSYVATRELRLSQGLFARASETEDNEMEPTSVTAAEAGVRFGLERSFRNDALALEVGASVVRLERIAPIGAPLPSRLDRQITSRARVSWRHDIDRRISSAVDAGVAVVSPYGSDPFNPGSEERRSGAFPVVGGSLNYTDVWGIAQLSVRRDVTPNLYIAQNTVNDSAIISAALPIPWRGDGLRRAPRLVGIGAFGVTRTQLVNPITSDLERSFGVARLDVGFMYAVRPGWSYGARYELMVQTGDSDAAMPIRGYFRNTLSFTFKVRYPEEIAAQIPKRRQNAVRADRGDTAPLGAEPVVPDLLGGGE